ncbi:MAG: helix-turn-helix transcriptional regulator [Firmicutes bacterium]|nr:helix-turn-helix transcriptional regulator [Bacillota bacterium]
MPDFADRLKELRLEEGLNQSELGRQTGIPQASITKWEAGHNDPSLKHVITLARFFEVTVGYMAGEEG